MCYPRRETWGNYKTQWRAWPGDTIGLPPTPAGATPGAPEQLPEYIRPRLDQEDLRGPAKPVRPVAPPVDGGLPPIEGAAPAANGAAAPALNGGAPAPPAGAAPAEGGEAAPPANDGLELPGFGPQGSLQPLPQTEDGPPALPPALSQAMISEFNTPIALQQAPIARTTVAANKSTAGTANKLNVLPTNSRYVTPASAVATGQIELSNPAAKNVQKSMNQELEQAIYFEASDITPGN
jgi:hypothetical protein